MATECVLCAADFDAPLDVSGGGSEAAGVSFVPDSEALVMITSMGFTVEQATKALKATVSNSHCLWILNCWKYFSLNIF